MAINYNHVLLAEAMVSICSLLWFVWIRLAGKCEYFFEKAKKNMFLFFFFSMPIITAFQIIFLFFENLFI